MYAPTLLIVEDEERMRRLFELVLKPAGYELSFAASGAEAVRQIQEQVPVDMIITDLQLGSVSGMEVLEAARQQMPDVPVLIVTGYGTVKSAVEAMQKGAYDYISKPVDNEELKIVIARALHLRELSRDNRTLRAGLQEQYGFDRIVSVSSQMELVKRLAREVAQTDSTVLITGESGTGKDLLARAIHLASPRAQGPLVALNCAGIPEHLLESELVGFEKGAFTDAKKGKPGRFQLADRGTLFLDEIGEMSLTAQAKLLRVLEHHVVEPLGGVRGIKVDIRVIAATNQELPDLIKQGRFRKDIRPILDSFLETARRERGSRIRGITPEALAILERYEWPGNVRELHNVVEWLTITCKQGEIAPDHLPMSLKAPGTAPHAPPTTAPSLLSLGLSVEEVEKAMLQEALQKSGGNVSEASRLLKVTRNTLRYRMAKYNLTQPSG
jgi:DNA-binding NtrC family response regulator